MGTRDDRSLFDDAILSFEDADAPIDAWTLDELDDSADLRSLRSALAGAGD